MRRARWLVTGLLLGTLALAACQSGQTAADREERPAQVLPVEGSDVHRVVLKPDAARRVGIETRPVREVAAADTGAQSAAVPVSALVYDSKGKTWVYTSPQPLTYVREHVTVARIEGDVAILESGPPPGTAVATVGAAELLGAEYGVEGQ